MGLYLLKFPYRKALFPLGKGLAWLHPDVVSYSAVAAAAGTGWCFYRAGDSPGLLIWAVALTLVRMTLNTLDGVMAIERGDLSLRGEIVNALPDRYSDLMVVGGVVLSPLCNVPLGVAALCSMALVSYTGMLGKALGVSWQHHGPLGKVERLIVLMVFSLIQFFYLRGAAQAEWFGISATPMEWAMGLFVMLGQVTVYNRLRGQLREIARKEALERLGRHRNRDRALVIFDSMTGNTRRVAEQIAAGLGCRAAHISQEPDPGGPHLVVLGSPNIHKMPSQAMQNFQAGTPGRPRCLAVFATFGMPVWGQISTPICLRSMAAAWDVKPIGRFACPGVQAKHGTYAGRPNEEDLLDAFLFGLKLSRKLDKRREAQGHDAA